MKIIKMALCLILAILTVCSLCACSKPQPIEERIESAVLMRGAQESVGVTIGGIEIRNSTTTVTNIKKISETEYFVNGRITMYDIYGDSWSNTFDCTVRQEETPSGKIWKSDPFEYTNTNWSKG